MPVQVWNWNTLKKGHFFFSPPMLLLAGSVAFLVFGFMAWGQNGRSQPISKRPRLLRISPRIRCHTEYELPQGAHKNNLGEGVASAAKTTLLNDTRDKLKMREDSTASEEKDLAVSQTGTKERKVSEEILELASSRTPQEHIATIINETTPETRSITVCRPAWALWVQLDREPQLVCQLVKEALLSDECGWREATLLLEVLAYSARGEATETLLDLLLLDWGTNRGSLVKCLCFSGRDAGRELAKGLEELDANSHFWWGSLARWRMQSNGPASPFREDVVSLLIRVFDARARDWPEWDRHQLIDAFSDILGETKSTGQSLQGDGKAMVDTTYVAAICARLRAHLSQVEDPNERAATVWALAKAPADNAWQILVEYLANDSDETVRMYCAMFLARIIHEPPRSGDRVSQL